MGFSSQAGHIALRSQAVNGTFQSDIATAGVVLRTRGGSMEPQRDLLVPDPEIGGGRDINDAYLGAVAWAGDVEFYARMKALPTLLKSACGTAGVVTTTGVSTHTITPADTALLPRLSMQQKIGSALEVYNYTDVVVNTLHLEAEANGYLMGTAGLIAIKETAGNTSLTSGEIGTIEDASPMIVGTNITITYNAVTVKAKSFSIDLNNNYENDDFQLGSFYLNQLSPKRREFTGSFTIRPEDSAMFRQAVYGGSALTAPAGTTIKQQMIITCSTYEDIPSGTPATKYSIAITIPKVALKPFALSPSGDDLVQVDVEFQALRPVTATPLFTAVLKNDLPAVA